ncbi:hypothetical protein LCGC14_2967410, partial [marine sediment metagenome]
VVMKITKNNENDFFSLLRPNLEVTNIEENPEEKLINNLQNGIFDVFRDNLIEYGIDKIKQYYPIWKEQWQKWKEKVKNWYQKK